MRIKQLHHVTSLTMRQHRGKWVNVKCHDLKCQSCLPKKKAHLFLIRFWLIVSLAAVLLSSRKGRCVTRLKTAARETVHLKSHPIETFSCEPSSSWTQRIYNKCFDELRENRTYWILCNYNEWLGRAGQENIWLEVKPYGPRAKQFPVWPSHSVNKYILL